MIIKLSTELALFTAWSSEREFFKPDTVHDASRAEAEWALNSVPLNEISSCPDSFRDLAIALLGATWVGEFSEASAEVINA